MTMSPGSATPNLLADPAEPFSDLKRRAVQAILATREQILDLSHRIHAHPEPAFEERLAAMWVAEAVSRHGYGVEHPAGRLETAVRGRLAGGLGGATPRIGILAEYDALPGLGHGCGHNTMAASGVAAAIGLAAVARDLPGEIVFLGTPAEERGSGKQVMIDDGLFAGLDAALLFHPASTTHVECHLLACEDVDVTFTGREAHAATDPWEGRNALDAMVMLLNGIALWRQQLRPDGRVHGIVLEGGTAANIIPAESVALFNAARNGAGGGDGAGARDGAVAARLFDRLRPLCAFIEESGRYVPCLKAGMAMRGWPVGAPRPPLLPLEAPLTAELHGLLAQATAGSGTPLAV